jgi:hypothetical protein
MMLGIRSEFTNIPTLLHAFNLMGYRAPSREAPWYRFAAILWCKPTALFAPRLSFTSYRKLDVFVILARAALVSQIRKYANFKSASMQI